MEHLITHKNQIAIPQSAPLEKEAPKGMLKMMKEIVELATDQNKIPVIRKGFEVMIELLKHRELTYCDLIDICETIETKSAPTLSV